MYEKAGFVLEGTKREGLLWDGEWVDVDRVLGCLDLLAQADCLGIGRCCARRKPVALLLKVPMLGLSVLRVPQRLISHRLSLKELSGVSAAVGRRAENLCGDVVAFKRFA
nr:hypothetical protein [Catenulispora pinisilvae]